MNHDHDASTDATSLLRGRQDDPLRNPGGYGQGAGGYAPNPSHLAPADPFYGGENPSYMSVNAPTSEGHTYSYDDETKIPLTDADEKLGYPPHSSSAYK